MGAGSRVARRGEILLTSIDRDGTKVGIRLRMTAAVSTGGLDPRHRVGRSRRTSSTSSTSSPSAPPTPRSPRRSFTTLKPVFLPLKEHLRAARHSGAGSDPSLMLIPSIDLQDGAVVELVQGERLAIRDTDVFAWVKKFAASPRCR